MTLEHTQDRETAPVHVAICIPTYKRPMGLRALLQSLNELDLDNCDASITLVIVDNAPESPASEDLGDLQSISRWPVIYGLEPQRGIVAARNRALYNVPDSADYIASLDDDETVSPQWLKAMLATLATEGTTVAQGPMVPVYETTPPKWIDQLGIFRIGPFAPNQDLTSAAAGNSMIDADFVRTHGLRYDMRFNTSGGEDEEFYQRVQRKGGRIKAAADAAARDHVPRQRMTWRWVSRREFRRGNTLGRLAIINRSKKGLRFAKGIGAIGWGASNCLVLGLGSKPRLIKGAMEICRGAGMISAFLGVQYDEYSDEALSLDRSTAQ